MMAQEPQHDHVEKLQTHQNDDDELKDLQMELEYNGFYDQVVNMAERFATTRIGQFVIERSDRLLRMIEVTAKWSLPQDSTEEKLVRPFGWITFLTLIVLLRFIRIGLSMAALMIGNSPVSAHDMVYFFQTRRRKLRAIRVHGLREIRQRELESKSGSNPGGFTGKISALLSIAICRPGQHREPGRRVFVRRERTQDCMDESERQTSKRPRDDDGAELNLTFDQLLSKYADENSEDDSDFLPPDDEESSDGTTTGASDTSCSNAEEELNKEVVAQNPKDTKSKNTTYNRMDKQKSQLNESVEVKENGIHKRPMPKPLLEIKREPLSDIDSGTEHQHSPKLIFNSTTNGNGNGETEQTEDKNEATPPPENKKLNVHHVQEKKATPGHESAALIKPAVVPALTTTATVGSPSDFNVDFKPVSILKNPIVSNTEIIEPADAHSTPKTQDDILESPPTDNSSTSSPPKKHVYHQHHNRNRYRGKTRLNR